MTMVVVGYLLPEAIFYLLQTYLTVSMVKLRYHGNLQMVYKFVQFDAHTHYHCQEKHNNKLVPP